jgi:hypothetical protein
LVIRRLQEPGEDSPLVGRQPGDEFEQQGKYGRNQTPGNCVVLCVVDIQNRRILSG